MKVLKLCFLNVLLITVVFGQAVSVYESSMAQIETPIAVNPTNPFNPKTHITFELPEAEEVQLNVFNIRGERVSCLISGHCNEGIYEVLFDGSALASGVYFYRLETKGFIQTKRMLLVK